MGRGVLDGTGVAESATIAGWGRAACVWEIDWTRVPMTAVYIWLASIVGSGKFPSPPQLANNNASNKKHALFVNMY